MFRCGGSRVAARGARACEAVLGWVNARSNVGRWWRARGLPANGTAALAAFLSYLLGYGLGTVARWVRHAVPPRVVPRAAVDR